MKKLALFLAILCFGLFGAQAEELQFYKHGNRNTAKIAISVDDCFDKSIVQGFLDTANQANVKLTFFIIGRTLHGDDDEAQIMALLADGHEIGNHSNNHKNMQTWSESKIAEDLQAFQTRLDKVLGFRYKPNLLRFPFGIGTTAPGLANYNSAAQKAGYQHIVYWDVVLDKPEQMLAQIQNGSIVLLHGNKKDLQVFKELLPALQEKYELCTISELLGIAPVKWDLY